MSTVAQILTRAYARSDAFIATVSADETTELVPLVDAKQKALFVRGAEVRFFSVDLAVAAASNKWTMPTDSAGLPYRVEEADGTKVSIVDIDDKEAEYAPRVYVVGNTLRTVNLTGDPDETADALTIYYNRIPTTLTATGDSLDAEFPIAHEQIIELEVALLLFRKARLLTEIQSLELELDAATATFEQELGLTPTKTKRYPTQ